MIHSEYDRVMKLTNKYIPVYNNKRKESWY